MKQFLFFIFYPSPGYFPLTPYTTTKKQKQKFASLTTIEPALGRKLTQPLIEIISRFNKLFFNPFLNNNLFKRNIFILFGLCVFWKDWNFIFEFSFVFLCYNFPFRMISYNCFYNFPNFN